MGVFGTKQSATRYDSVQQTWVTPDDVFKPIDDEFHFTLDAAADADNAKAPKFFTREQDGLKQDWGSHTVWVNPPYGDSKSKLSDWVKKAAHAAFDGATVVMLIPARTNTAWFHEWCLARGEVRFIRGRPKFIGCTHGLPQPLCFVIFRPGLGDMDGALRLRASNIVAFGKP